MPYKPREVVSKLNRAGFSVRRQNGSHALLKHSDGRKVVVAMHSKDVPTGTFHAILDQAGLTLEEFRKL